ncbi:MAG: GAF domain-containing protein, partial [Myxococcota bacterium]
ELWSKIVQGSVNIEIRLQLGQGIAGWVALTGKSLNIRDAYRDPRFNPKVDESTGYLTRNILCQPIRNLQGDIIGVIQVLNRRRGNFSDEDEYLLSAIASQAAVAIENSKLSLSAIEQNMELIEIKDKLEHKVGELDMLYELERLLSRASNLERLIEGTFEKTLQLVHASVGALILHQDGHQHAYVLYDEGDWQSEWVFRDYPIERVDTLGAEAIRRNGVVMATLEDAEFRGAMARAAATWGVAIENGLALPLVVDEEYIGSVEVLNTIDLNEAGEVGFTEDDRKILSVVASQLAAEIVTRRRREEEEKNERLASIGQMLSGVLHDFKNPMAIISGYVQLMNRAEDADRRTQFAGNILRQLDQLNQMTRELLAFARGERILLLRKAFIHRFIEEVSELLTPELATRGVEIDIELEYRTDYKLDHVKMKRAILNLARNAADAIGPAGGTFKIRVWLDEEHDDAVFVFTDDGPGIPEHIHDTLFESFVTHGKADGTGLGLAIVQRIVEDHGGSIDFVTELGVGTSFIVRIPRNPATEESSA